MADILKEKFALETELTPGNRGEFTVWLDGKELARKVGDEFPTETEVETAVRQALAA